ncbi:hypothetical protein DV736_g2098, partial [Chaetothyriales sp. CBS 134916]
MRRSDYRAPSLHPNARDTRKTRAATTTKSSSALAVGVPTVRTTGDDGDKGEDEDVMRMPESSSSDEDNAPEPVSTSYKERTSSKRKLDEKERPAGSLPTRQSKRPRQKLQDTKADLPAYSTNATKSASFTTDDDLWGMLPPPSLSASQRESQKRKRVYTSSMRKKEELKTFKPDIKTVGEDEDGEGMGRRLEIKKPPWSLEELATPLESFTPMSSMSSSTNAHHMLDLKGSPIRSPSSLSSLGSLSPSQEDSAKPPRQKAHNEATTQVVCTVCRKKISVALLQDMEKNMKSLSLQSQRDICHKHRLAEAQDVSRDRGYPAAAIDWAQVECVRIPRLLTHLRQVLQRKTPSFYLEQLDAHAIAAKQSKPRLLRTYLHSGVLDVVKPGYYGPKGQKVVCDAVTNALTSDLKQASREDHVVRAAGIGAYVAAVLVPECTMRLVMEDIKTRSQDWAREVLSESSDIGRLLNPDDDRVEVVDGE